MFDEGRRGGVAGVMACVLVVSWWLCHPAVGAEQVVQNDSIAAGGSGNIQAGFAANESAAAWLTAPCSGNIVAVQVLWLSQLGNAGQTVEDSITIFDGGIFPTPGAQLEILQAPVMTDGGLNEFRFLDENNTIPLSVPVTAGQVFVVSFKFFNTVQPGGASVVTDLDGCQANKNAINALGIGWISACALGVSGDFAIRAVIDCVEPAGACCFADGSCVDGQTNLDCSALGGTFQGGGTTCAGVSCPQPTGACCFMPSGCVNLSQADCGTAGGFWQGAGTDCATTTCFPVGACCLPDGSCGENMAQADCIAAGGAFQGNGVLCSAVSCPQPTGACCLSNGNCLVLIQTDCVQIPSSVWAGPQTNCDDLNMNGTADACETNPCSGIPLGDYGAPTGTDGLDVQPFVDALTSSSPTQDQICHGDFNGNAVLDVGDVDGMVTALLAGP